MNFLNVLSDFKKLCCDQETLVAATACRVYMDLIAEKIYCSINKCYNSSLDICYLKAETYDKKKVIILPFLITQELDLNIIHKLQSDEKEINFLLAICDTSSNILYYRQMEAWDNKQ